MWPYVHCAWEDLILVKLCTVMFIFLRGLIQVYLILYSVTCDSYGKWSTLDEMTNFWPKTHLDFIVIQTLTYSEKEMDFSF